MSLNFRSQLRHIAAKHARDYAVLMSEYKPEDKEVFSEIIQGCTRHGLSQATLADEFKVSPATISRWCAGKSIPPQYVRGVIVERAADLLRAKADEVELASEVGEHPSVGHALG